MRKSRFLIYGCLAITLSLLQGELIAQLKFTQTDYSVPFSGSTVGNHNGPFVKVADFNNDGWQDLVMADPSGPLQVMLNLGSGAFDAPQSYQILPAGDGAVNVDVGDFNEDGFQDIVVSPNNAFAFGVGPGIFYGTGTGTFNSIVFPTAPVTYSIATGDFNNDGHLDILSSYVGVGAVLLGDGLGNFAVSSLTGTTLRNMIPTNLDLNSTTDFVHYDGSSDVYSAVGLGGGVFSTIAGITTGDTYAYVADVTGDFVPDLISKSCCTIRIFAGNGDGSFQTTPFTTLTPSNSSQVIDVKVVDIDGDSKVDIVETHTAASGLNKSWIGVFRGDGLGNFSTSELVAASPELSPKSYQQFTLGDFTNDGLLDIAVIDRTNGFLQILLNTPLPPIIDSFSPASGLMQSLVHIQGQNLANTISVAFDGLPTQFTIVSPTEIIAVVPDGVATGPISVSSPVFAQSSSSPFVVINHAPTGNVVTLNGTSDFVQADDDPSLHLSSLTLEAWIKFTHVTGFAAFIAKSKGTTTQNSYALWYESGRLAGGINVVSVASGISYDWLPVENEWYHVALTYDDVAQSQVLYLNGRQVASGNASSAEYDGQPLTIGADVNFGTSGGHLFGSIDEVRIWNFARSPLQIAAALDLTLTGTESGLIANYRMDESNRGAGIPVQNASTATGNTLTAVTVGSSCTPVFTNNPPSISSFVPASGTIGTTVTITGTGFHPNLANNLVTFNGKPATLVTSTPTNLEVIVPSGATTGLIQITSACLSGVSSTPFTVSTAVIQIDNHPIDVVTCDGGVATFTALASGTTNLTYRWQFSNDGNTFVDIADNSVYSGTSTASLSVATTNSFGGGFYRCRVNGDGAAEVLTNRAQLDILPLPTDPVVTPKSNCGPGVVTLTASGSGSGQYRWYTTSSGASPIPGETGASYQTPSLLSTTTYFVSVFNGSCESTRTAIVATILPLPTPPTISSVQACMGNAAKLIAAGGIDGQYRWYSFAMGSVLAAATTSAAIDIFPATSDLSYFVALNDGVCESSRSVATLKVLQVPLAPIVADVSFCGTQSVTLTASGATNGQYRWYTTSTGGTAIASATNASYTTAPISSTTTFYIAIDNGACEGPRTAATATSTGICNTAPSISTATIKVPIGNKGTIDLNGILSDAENNIDVSTLRIARPPISGAHATIDVNLILEIDYTGIDFAGVDELAIEVCDVVGACTENTLTVDVVGSMTVYNAISPGNDNFNDIFYLEYVNFFESTKRNRVTIYNRWGDLVFDVEDYDNVTRVFRGVSNSGQELPSGTYFYRITFASSEPKREGYLSIRR